MDQQKKNPGFLVLVCFSAALGGFLFGFDTAVASGTIGFLREQFRLTPAMEGWIMSVALLGSVIGAAFAGYLSDRFGRKKMLITSALLFLVSAIGCMIPETPQFLVAARLVGGFGVGIAAMVAPIFISELAPPQLRGRLVSFYQLAITLGILASYLSNTFLLSVAESYSGTSATGFLQLVFIDEVWRGMFGSEVMPAALYLIMLLFVPESPRWYYKENRTSEAEAILLRILGPEETAREMDEIREVTSKSKGSVLDLFKPGLRMALVIGLLLPVFSQLTGITTVMYYAPSIFERAGFQSASAFGSAAVIGFVNMMFTFVAIWKIDRVGRKPLLIMGFSALILALTGIGWQFNSGGHDVSLLLLGLFVFYIMFFAATIGPGVWVVMAEIFPTHIRGRGMAVSTLTLFIGSTVVTQTYPMLREGVGIGNTFFLYGLCMIPAVMFVWKKIPETKGKTLEEIQKHWKKWEI
jgi:SP family arabinose:H+ symporter-like MFS transporter